MAAIAESTCENPQFPNWMWRYNRNKRLSSFQPWFTRAERWPPHYRNMGVHDNFRFHPVAPHEEVRPYQQLGVNYAHKLVIDRQTGYGNGMLGCTPGPAPPRMVVYNVNPSKHGDLYRVNEIYGISDGMSLLDNSPIKDEPDDLRQPLNPRQYLEKTLGQPQEYPGTFPHYNLPAPSTTGSKTRTCPARMGVWNPLEQWLWEYRRREAEIAQERRKVPGTYLAPIYQQPCRQETITHVNYEGMRPPTGAGPDRCMSERKIY